jgi:hypothetical protein
MRSIARDSRKIFMISSQLGRLRDATEHYSVVPATNNCVRGAALVCGLILASKLAALTTFGNLHDASRDPSKSNKA